MTLITRTLKEKHLEFLKAYRNEEKFANDNDSKNYLDDCIEILERELHPQKFKPDYLIKNENIIPQIRTLGYDYIEAVILSYLISSTKKIAVGDLLKLLDCKRGKIYRALARFDEEGLVTKSGIGLTRFSIRNRDNPFESIIQKKFLEYKSIKDFKLNP